MNVSMLNQNACEFVQQMLLQKGFLMAKITAVIDIGSNSVRMAVYKKTSALGFYLLEECKSRVRISEESYKHDGNLQALAIQRTVRAIGDFLSIAKSFKARKILCVATSAVRDAPNKKEFLGQLKDKYSLQVRVISGEHEALYGARAALNLLTITDGLSVDIGGGSCELGMIKNAKITQTSSLDLGTVRLKEKFFDKDDFSGAKQYIIEQTKSVNFDLQTNTVIAIGGTLRSIANVIMKKNKYYPHILHNFTYKVDDEIDFIESITKANKTQLLDMGFKSERLDVIKEGTSIFLHILRSSKAKWVITSGVGVREGVFLTDLLKGGRFPKGFNPSVRSLCDRFGISKKETSFIIENAMEIFKLTRPLHRLDNAFIQYLVTAIKLLNVGKQMNFYKRFEEGFDVGLYALNYGFSHTDRLIVATILDSQQKKSLENFSVRPQCQHLLPDLNILYWLSAIVFVATLLHKDRSCKKPQMSFKNNCLYIKSSSYLINESISSCKIGDLRISTQDA